MQFDLVLDAEEPFLNHHRPGGLPLFGTVMGIEAMVSAAMRCAGLQNLTSCSVINVQIRSPIILQERFRQATINVTQPFGMERNHFVCEVTSKEGDFSTATHFKANVILNSLHSFSEKKPWVNNVNELAFTVTAAQVYKLFFHGPAFQVIHAAALSGKTLVTELNPDLHALRNEVSVTPLSIPAQLIELCLQTAGLHDIAMQSRMMIPHRIARIDWVAAPEESSASRRFGFATPSVGASLDCVRFDMRLADESQQVFLQISEYETAPLPFPSDADGISELSKCFDLP
jgi:Polyketide synthase dehydratase